KEVPVRPPTDPPTEGLRFVEQLDWVNSTKIRVGGSMNPRNCELFDLDVETGRESNWQMGACGSFVWSPDGKHVAYRGLLAMGPEDEQDDTIEIDDEKVVYAGGGQRINVSGSIKWSADSKTVAFLERLIGQTALNLTALTINGNFAKVAVSPKFA